MNGLLINTNYSLIEAHVLAMMSVDTDIHTQKAKEIFHTNNPTREQRNRAKVHNYLTAYSASPYIWF